MSTNSNPEAQPVALGESVQPEAGVSGSAVGPDAPPSDHGYTLREMALAMADGLTVDRIGSIPRANAAAIIRALVEQIEHPAPVAPCERCAAVNAIDVTDIWVTTGHHKCGIECTAVVNGNDQTVTNQPSVVDAIIAAVEMARTVPNDDTREMKRAARSNLTAATIKATVTPHPVAPCERVDALHAAASDLRFVASGGECDPRTLLAHADVLSALAANGQGSVCVTSAPGGCESRPRITNGNAHPDAAARDAARVTALRRALDSARANLLVDDPPIGFVIDIIDAALRASDGGAK